MLIKEDLSRFCFPHLRTCTSAGEPLNPEVSSAWKKGTGLEIREGWGQTETTLILSTLVGEKVKYGAIGRVLPGFQVAIADDLGQQLPQGEEGNLAVSLTAGTPKGVFEGYASGFEDHTNKVIYDEEANCKVFRHGWYFTGDRATVDQEGLFTFVGRADDVIKTSGFRVGPFEVESALVEHPSVMEAAVIGIPDEAKGQVIKAFVVLAQGHKGSEVLANELKNHVRKVTAPFKVPKVIEFVEDLPKTISGKIRRVELRQKSSSSKL
jgi:acyl-coenzyme A synthetase/AMP-(fatty) acid ligase